MVFMAGRLQRVETVDDSSDDDSAPPPLEDIDVPAGSASGNDTGLESDDEPPALLNSDGPHSDDSAEEGDGSEAPPLGESELSEDDDSGPPSATSDEDADDIPALTGGSEEEDSGHYSETSDECPPDLDDPEVSAALEADYRANGPLANAQLQLSTLNFSSGSGTWRGAVLDICVHLCMKMWELWAPQTFNSSQHQHIDALACSVPGPFLLGATRSP
jgi:hypothetical protein